jgi:hypothetical protein
VSQGSTFADALIALIGFDPATYELLQNYADIMVALAFGWDGSPDSAFELFDVRPIGRTARHPDGKTQANSAGATDVVKVSGARTSMSQSDVDDRFNNSDFPCGEGDVATTFCPDGAGDFNAEVPLDSTDRSYQYLVAFDDGDPANNVTDEDGGYSIGTDRQYTLTYTPASGWSLVVTNESGAASSAARWILRSDAMVLVIPADELATRPSFRLAAFENGGELDPTNTDDWSGDVVPAVGAQLSPVIPLEAPRIIEVGTATDPTGDAESCDGGALDPAAVNDITEVVHTRRGRRALIRLTATADLSSLLESESGVGLVIALDFPGGIREWTASANTNTSRLIPDDPGRGEHPTVFAFGDEIELLFKNDLPSGSTLTVRVGGPDDGACDTVTYSVP